PPPQRPSLGSGLFCPGPSSLSRPHPPHSLAHRDFTAWRLIRDAFAVRERRGDPRVVPGFHCSFLPGMPSSPTPGSPTSICSRTSMPTSPSPHDHRLGTPNSPAIRSTRASHFVASLVRFRCGLPGCSPRCTTMVETHWRLPGSWVDRLHPNIGMFEEVARTAERGGFDMIFFGDSTGIPDTWEGSIEDAVRHGVAWPRFEMSPWIATMARVTHHLGFGLTYASTFMHPFYTARLLNSLDHITNGRIAFNVITSQRRADYANYGYDELVDHNERYDRLEEFIDVCRALWTSVAPDAFVWDRKTGIVADKAKVHAINHVGKFFKVKGPLSV